MAAVAAVVALPLMDGPDPETVPETVPVLTPVSYSQLVVACVEEQVSDKPHQEEVDVDAVAEMCGSKGYPPLPKPAPDRPPEVRS